VVSLLILSLAVTGVGAVLYTTYFLAPVSNSSVGDNTIQIGYNDTSALKVNGFYISFDLASNEIAVFWSYEYTRAGTYDLMVILPVRVSAAASYLPREAVTTSTDNVPGTGSIVIARVSAQSYVNQSNSGIELTMKSQDDLITGQRGQYVTYIPYGQTIPIPISDELRRLNYPVPVIGPGAYHVFVSVGLPIESNDISSAPSIHSPVFINTNLAPAKWYQWSFNSTQSVSIQYTTGEGAYYQQVLFFGGLVFGVGISFLSGVVLEFFKLRQRQSGIIPGAYQTQNVGTIRSSRNSSLRPLA